MALFKGIHHIHYYCGTIRGDIFIWLYCAYLKFYG